MPGSRSVSDKARRKQQLQSAALAREQALSRRRIHQSATSSAARPIASPPQEVIAVDDNIQDCTKWNGTDVCWISSGDESPAVVDVDSEGDVSVLSASDEEEIQYLGESAHQQDIREGGDESEEEESRQEGLPTSGTATTWPIGLSSSVSWEEAEASRGLGYSGNSARTKRRKRADAEKKEEQDAETRKSATAQKFCQFFSIKPAPSSSPALAPVPVLPRGAVPSKTASSTPYSLDSDDLFEGYASDRSCQTLTDSEEEREEDEEATRLPHISSIHPSENFGIRPVAPRKRKRLDVSYRQQRQQKQQAKEEQYHAALTSLDKRIRSKKSVWVGGQGGLQFRRAAAMRACLHMMVGKRKRRFVDASQRSAEVHRFSARRGGRSVRKWVTRWVKEEELPTSRRGAHKKVSSLLDDADVSAEIRQFLRSNKWAMDPQKLESFLKKELLPQEASRYGSELVNFEIPKAVGRYLTNNVCPRLGLKVVKSISLSTARRWMKKEGFSYTHYSKALYYDGHERPDVVKYRQEEFLPTIREYWPRLVRYDKADNDQKVNSSAEDDVRPLVLVAQDEMTAQCNDGNTCSWVWKGEQPLRKKGKGKGLHRSDVVCSTVGYLVDAGQGLEYGKNYEGYWTGELFVTQIKEKIVPAFEAAHPNGEQMLLMVDNSQGHSCYALDALLTKRMNLSSGGKQAIMRDGWYMKNGERVTQSMVFPADHEEYPNGAKGIRQVLEERGLWRDRLLLQCKKQKDPALVTCGVDSNDCCARQLLSSQPDFFEQRSAVQEAVEEAGHICIVLPKFHCELNFIEHFWCDVKRYLRTNCDFTWETLRDNMPLALASVPLERIRKYEHRMHRWLEAYEKGMDAKAAQTEVKKYSSRIYTSHRRIPEAVNVALDAE